MSRYKCAKRFTFNDEKVMDNVDVVNALKDADGNMKDGIVRYKLNANDEITLFQTADTTYTKDGRLFVEAKIPKQGEGVGVLFKKNYGNLFSTYFALEDNAAVFVIPTDKTDYDKYIMGGPEIFDNDDTVYGVTGYKLKFDDDRCAAAVYGKSVKAGGGAVARKPSIVKSVKYEGK